MGGTMKLILLMALVGISLLPEDGMGARIECCREEDESFRVSKCKEGTDYRVSCVSGVCFSKNFTNTRNGQHILKLGCGPSESKPNCFTGPDPSTGYETTECHCTTDKCNYPKLVCCGGDGKGGDGCLKAHTQHCTSGFCMRRYENTINGKRSLDLGCARDSDKIGCSDVGGFGGGNGVNGFAVGNQGGPVGGKYCVCDRPFCNVDQNSAESNDLGLDKQDKLEEEAKKKGNGNGGNGNGPSKTGPDVKSSDSSIHRPWSSSVLIICVVSIFLAVSFIGKP